MSSRLEIVATGGINCSAYLANTQTIGAGVTAELLFDGEIIDFNNMHDPIAEPHRFNTIVRGPYLICFNIRTTTTLLSPMVIRLKVDGTMRKEWRIRAIVAVATISDSFSTKMELLKDEVLTVEVVNNSAASIVVNKNADATWIDICLL